MFCFSNSADVNQRLVTSHTTSELFSRNAMLSLSSRLVPFIPIRSVSLALVSFILSHLSGKAYVFFCSYASFFRTQFYLFHLVKKPKFQTSVGILGSHERHIKHIEIMLLGQISAALCCRRDYARFSILFSVKTFSIALLCCNLSTFASSDHAMDWCAFYFVLKCEKEGEASNIQLHDTTN